MNATKVTTANPDPATLKRAMQALGQGNFLARVAIPTAGQAQPEAAVGVTKRSGSTPSRGGARRPAGLRHQPGTGKRCQEDETGQPGDAGLDALAWAELGCSFNHMAESLSQWDSERTQFLGMAAHDMQSPLMVILNASRTLRDGRMSPEAEQDCLDCLQRNVTSLQYVIADVIDGLQAQASHLQLKLEIVDLTALVRDLVQDYSATALTHRLCFQGDGACPILGDRERLKRIALNLLSNAVKYSEPGQEVTISVWRRGADTHLIVQDHGAGVATSDIERMFLPFERLDHTRALASGFGLGLVSVQRLVEAHGGDIKIQGAPQRGTTVEICLKSYWPEPALNMHTDYLDRAPGQESSFLRHPKLEDQACSAA